MKHSLYKLHVIAFVTQAMFSSVYWLVGWFVSGITQKLLNISTKPGLRMDLGITVGTAVANTGLATWLHLAAWLLFKAYNLIERMLVLNSN